MHRERILIHWYLSLRGRYQEGERKSRISKDSIITTVKYLLKNSLDLVDRRKESLKSDNIVMKDLAKTIAIKDKNYILSYQPATTGIVNMRQQYVGRVTRRIYGN